MSDFYNQVVYHYSRINFPKQYLKLYQLDGPISWYFADDSNQFISANGVIENRKLFEIDIKSAYPSICNHLLSDVNPKFVKKMNQITDKRERNIFIATTLKGSTYLKELNVISKLIILGFIFDLKKNDDILLLELKKDGCVVLTNDDTYEELLYNEDRSFVTFLKSKNFDFHTDLYLKYIRTNRTSMFFKENENEYELIIKGAYKYLPNELIKVNKQILSDTNPDLLYLDKIYSYNYYNILKLNNLHDLIQNYYICNNNMILNMYGKYEKIKVKNEINPKLYLEKFVYPILLAEKMS